MIFNQINVERRFAKQYRLKLDDAVKILYDIRFHIDDYKRRSVRERRRPVKLVRKALYEDHKIALSRFAVMRWYRKYKKSQLSAQ